MEKIIKIYQLADCPYCQMVQRKLSYLGLSYLAIPVPKNQEDRKDVLEVSGQPSVPVIVDGDQVVNDSQKILEYLDKKYGDGKGEHLPANKLAMAISMKGNLAEIKEKVLEALKKEGFGVLTEIDVKATLKKKMDVDVEEHLILGACNPQMAHKAMEMEPDISLLLPCNVTLRYKAAGEYWVSAIHPVKMFSLVGRDDMLPLAGQGRDMLQKALDALEQ